MFITENENKEKKVEEQPLSLKYRPKIFEAVVGQDAVIKSLKGFFPDKVPHAFLFVGGSGCGKTTLARIIANELKIDKLDVLEIDAAIHTGVDDMRGVTDGLQYKGYGPNGTKMVILDECHMLSKSAWNSILKELEEAPKHVYWVLCTTDPGKVPDTINTRCTKYTLKEVGYDDMMDLLEYVMGEENITLPNGALDVIIRKSEGSPRMALVCLAQARSCSTKEEVSTILQSIEESDVVSLCRILADKNMSQDRWERAKKVLDDLKNSEPESVRIPIVKYLGSCLRKANSSADAIRFDEIMTPFLNPTSKSTGMEEIWHICAQILLS